MSIYRVHRAAEHTCFDGRGRGWRTWRKTRSGHTDRLRTYAGLLHRLRKLYGNRLGPDRDGNDDRELPRDQREFRRYWGSRYPDGGRYMQGGNLSMNDRPVYERGDKDMCCGKRLEFIRGSRDR